MEEQEHSNTKKWAIIGSVILLLLVVAIVLLLTFGRETTVARSIGSVLPFGQLGEDAPRQGFEGGGESGGEGGKFGSGALGEPEPRFKQLTDKEVAGATAIVRDGKTFVRYVLRENGSVHEIDISSWQDKELTGFVAPRIYEAYFGNNANTVVLRYLRLNETTRQDEVVTFLGDLTLPPEGSGELGKLRGRDLPVNISSVSVSPNGDLLFFLYPLADGVSGQMMYLSTDEEPREVLRNSFSEWLPQALDNGTIILTTKPSYDVPGYAYLYDTAGKAMTRLVREKKGMVTLGNNDGSRVLFNENVGEASTLWMHDKKGFGSEMGVTVHETPIPLTTLPEKCVWGTTHRTMFYCASFQSTGGRKTPDEWYQGTLALKDWVWMIDSDSSEITLLAEPQKEAKRDFDVLAPFMGNNDKHFYFTDKTTGFLWVMRIDNPAGSSSSYSEDLPPPPTPEEEGDYAGSVGTTSSRN